MHGGKGTARCAAELISGSLMSQCNCAKYSGGRGSAIGYFHEKSKRKLIFDGPHPGNELYRYQIKKVLEFLSEIGEI